MDTSGSTFAGIRNSLNERRQGWADVESNERGKPSWRKPVELNTIMVWDDIDASIFIKYPDLYRMFKFGYDRRTDKIIISSDKVGENLEFHCFCPKVFSSVSPLHLDDRFKELKRRLLVIPCKRIEEISDSRKAEMGITRDNWQFNLLDVDAIDWKGFHKEFESFWGLDNAQVFLKTRDNLSRSVKGLNSQQRAISLDLMACGITCGIWTGLKEATAKLKLYWDWFKQETEANANLSQLLREYIKQEKNNAKAGNTPLAIATNQIRSQVDIWFYEGWLLERPKMSQVQEAMLDLGMRSHKGIWRKV